MPEQPEQPEVEQSPVEQVDEATDVATPVVVADDVLLDSVELARRALLEVAAPETVGSVVGHLVEEEHVLTLLFAADLSGYPGWHWSVTITRVDDAEPTVLETELMPGESALLAPDWVPWSERLADYRAAQEAAAAAAAEASGGGPVDQEAGDEGDEELDELEDEDEDEDEDVDDEDLDDEAELDAAFGHDAGDDVFDGIDIDAFDDSGAEDRDDDADADVDAAEDDAEAEAADDQPAEPRS
ncbi:DUF3027 domain-containing protein [Agromyces bauzanensis]